MDYTVYLTIEVKMWTKTLSKQEIYKQWANSNEGDLELRFVDIIEIHDECGNIVKEKP